ncbi:programmed cell death protein 6-like [Ornithodoros turicata]|uniref:programmed cell death protein 6-like n=1 Tax=Ornithodoros turicata TaxID=34597 RepID=UPI003139EDCF
MSYYGQNPATPGSQQRPGGVPTQPYGQTRPNYGQQPAYGQPGANPYGATTPHAYGAATPNPYGGAPPQSAPYGYPPAPPGVAPFLWNLFAAVDQDRNGHITARELRAALINGNWSPFNEETCRLMISMFDRDNSGTIDVHEFVSLWNYIEQWKRCFQSFDRDNSGNINVTELHQALTSFGYRLSVPFCQLAITKFDRYARGSIEFDDFIQLCVMIHCLTEAFRRKDTTQTGVVTLQYEEFLQMVLNCRIGPNVK